MFHNLDEEDDVTDEEEISTEFLDELNRGGVS